MKISKLDMNHLRNDAHFQFHTEFRDLAIPHGAAALKIKPQFDAYLLLYEREDDALKKIVKSALTAKIHDADVARDDTFIGMADICKGMCRHSSPAVRDAARRIQVVIDTYGNVTGKPLNEETSAIYNLVQELQSNYAADLAATNMVQWVGDLKARNEAFESLVKERFDETASKTDVVLRLARKASDGGYKEICDIVDVYVVLEGPAAYESFVRKLCAVIANYAVRHHRHNHAHAHPEAAQTGG